MPRQTAIFSWELGGFDTNNVPSNSNLTISTTYARSSATGGSLYGLRVNGVSGVNSSLLTPIKASTYKSIFVRHYINIRTLGSATRCVARFAALAAAAANLELRLTSTGVLQLASNGGATVYGSSNPLLFQHWTRFEIGVDFDSKMVALKIDGSMEIDWVAGPATMVPTDNFYIGTLDTVASAPVFWLDDGAADAEVWPGPGRGVALRPTGVISNSGWGLGAGASMTAAVNEVLPDGDTSYVTSPTATLQELVYSFDDCPTNCREPNGALVWVYGKSNTTTATDLNVRPMVDAFNITSNQLAPAFPSSATSYAWFSCQFEAGQSLSDSILMSGWTKDLVNGISVSMLRGSNSRVVRVSSVIVEMDYRYAETARPIPRRELLIGGYLDEADTEIVSVNYTRNGGNLSMSTVQAHSGSYSIRVNGTNGYVQALFPKRQVDLSFWIYVATRQAANDQNIFTVVTNRSVKSINLKMASNGGLIITNAAGSGLIAASAANTIPVGQWMHVKVSARRNTITNATDGFMSVWVDDVLIFALTAMNYGTVGTSQFLRWGRDEATNGYDCFFDDIIVDGGGSMPTRDCKVALVLPASAGTVTNAGYTANTGTKPAAVDDPEGPSDGDTTYVITSGVAGNDERWAVSLLPSDALRVLAVAAIFQLKRNGATDGSVIPYVTLNGVASNSAAVATTVNYDNQKHFLKVAPQRGAHTVYAVNHAEIGIKENSANKTRVTRAAMIVEYSTEPESRAPSSFACIVS